MARLAELRVPPAWKDVWICSDPMGHLQATGIDAAGRKQYLYHERWRQRRDAQKFDEMLDFARALPRLRRRVGEDLASGASEPSREAVLACGVRLLDRGLFRIGGEDYAEENETYGLATLHRSHLTIAGEAAAFDYTAKGGLDRELSIPDPDVLPVLKRLKARRSADPELLAYKDGRRWRDLRSEDINAYIKEAGGSDEFSAKDFRTWHATVLASVALAEHDPPPSSAAARKRAINEAVKAVAAFLGNTPAVSRRSYIDPRVIDRFQSGVTITAAGRKAAKRPLDQRAHRTLELAVVRMIEG